MAGVKVLFISMEIALLLCVVLCLCVEQTSEVWVQKVLVAACSLGALLFHHEQNKIAWDDED